MPQVSVAHMPMFFTQVPSYVKGQGLNSTDKMVFGTIYTMLNVNNVCFMSNSKIAKETEVKPGTVSKIISKLKDKGFINVKLIYKEDSKQVDKRLITLGDFVFQNQSTPPYDENTIPPYDENARGMVSKCEENRLLNRLKEEEEEGHLKTYKSAWNESENLNPITAKKLIKLCKNYGQSLFDYAIEVAAESNVKFSNSYRYLNSILNDWSKNNVKDVQGAKKYVEGRKAKTPRKKKYGHTPKKENLPDWAKESDEDRKARKEKEKADHEYKMKHDPKYRKEQEETKRNLEENLKKIRSWRKDADA